jgi:hypothetical protein
MTVPRHFTLRVFSNFVNRFNLELNLIDFKRKYILYTYDCTVKIDYS